MLPKLRNLTSFRAEGMSIYVDNLVMRVVDCFPQMGIKLVE